MFDDDPKVEDGVALLFPPPKGGLDAPVDGVVVLNPVEEGGLVDDDVPTKPLVNPVELLDGVALFPPPKGVLFVDDGIPKPPPPLALLVIGGVVEVAGANPAIFVEDDPIILLVFVLLKVLLEPNISGVAAEDGGDEFVLPNPKPDDDGCEAL